MYVLCVIAITLSNELNVLFFILYTQNKHFAMVIIRKNVPKIMDPKNRDLHFHGGSMRKGKWFDRMINDKMDDLLNGVQNIVNGGSK